MGGKYLAGVDVGTTGTKVIIFDLNGNIVSSDYIEYECIYPKPNWVEQDANMLIEAVYKCSKGALEKGNIKEDEIISISASAQRSCTVFIDKNGKPLKIISWLDNRANEQVSEIEDKLGRDKFYEITGMPLCTTWMLPKILHARKYNKPLWDNTVKITQLQDLIINALGVEGYYSNEPEASFYGFWDNKNFCYSNEIMETFDIDKSMFSEMKRSGDVVGEVSEYVARRTGFVAGTPICVGIGDQNSAALGAGIIKKGYISISLGTGGLATALLDSCYRDPKGQTMITNHAIHGMWTFEGLQNAAAGAFRWFRDEIAAYEKYMDEQNGKNVFETLNKMILDTPVGAKGVLMLPFFAGSAAPRWNSLAKGGFLGLTFAHDRACMARACVEGITLEQKDIITSIEANGVNFELARIMGGATKSEIWNQIQADVYNIPCETLEIKDAAVLGAAICAGVGVGTFSSINDAVESMVKSSKRYEPNPANVKKYNEIYEVYCDVFQALEKADIFSKLDKLQNI